MVITGTTYSVSHYEEYRKTGNSNIFEEVIDSMILDGIAGMNESFRSAILNLPIEDKRMVILSLLDKDLNLFKKIKALTNKKIDRLEHIKDIILMLREYVKVGEVEKKKFGEVMTPLELVKEMLATLPEEVWSNPNLKWLDPANGTGPYPAVVIYKLMKGLEEWEPDAEKRYKHIVENMIYTCELQAKNIFLWLCVVDPFDEYTTNTYWGSFLDEGFDKHMKEVWGIDKVDIVIGNPPYNNDGGLKTGGKNLYQKFILKSLDIYNKYLCYVTPPGFYKTTIFDEKNKIFAKITSEYNLLYLNSTDINLKYFNVGTPIVYYLIENTEYQKSTKIESDYGTFLIDVSEYSFIPRIVSNESFSILKKISSIGTKIKSFRDDKFKIDIDSFLTLSTMNHLSSKGFWNVEVGTSENRKRIIIKTDNPENLKKVIDSEIYRFAFYAYRHDGAVYHNFISGFRVPDDFSVDIFDFFKISNDEKSFIRKILNN